MALDFDAVRLLLEGVPYLDAAAGRALYDFVRGAGPEACLELGFAHGVSSCYIAAALAARGRGHLTTVDLEASATRAPTIETLLERTGLAAWVTVCREPHSYTWFLKKEIERRTRNGRCEPAYDFCYVDGCKNWTIDGLTFFLVDKLLRRGGWILFDDYGWSYARRARAVGKHTTDGIVHREMSPDQLEQPNVELIFRYLVMQHPDYGEFRVEGDWAWARKARGDRRAPVAGPGKGGGRHDAC